MIRVRASNAKPRLRCTTWTNDTTERIAGSERLAFYPQYHRVGWSAESDSIVFAGQRASIDTVGDYENAVWSVPVGGGTPQKLLVLDQFDQDPDLYLGLIPCSLVPPSAFAGLSPSRIMDTRSGLGVRQGFVGPRGTVSLDVTGVGGVPASGVEAVALNVTVARTSARSYLTVYPDGVAQPTASNMNWNGGGAPDCQLGHREGRRGRTRQLLQQRRQRSCDRRRRRLVQGRHGIRGDHADARARHT